MDESASAPEEWVSGTIKLNLFGEPVEMQLTVPANPVKVRRMLPIFRAVSDSFSEVGEAAVNARGERVSCQKGCAACCRYVIPVTETEIFELRDWVENQPEPRRTEIKRRFADAVERMSAKNWFERIENIQGMPFDEQVALNLEYIKEKIDCPFLENEVCLIHAERPFACREYLVTSPAEHCWEPTPENVKPVKMVFKVAGVARKFNRDNRFVPLIKALDFAASAEEDQTTKPGTAWMGDFLMHLKEYLDAKNNSPA